MIREVMELDGANPYARRIEYYEFNEVIGYLEYSFIYDRMEIDNLFVEEIHRKKGIGKKLRVGLFHTTGNKSNISTAKWNDAAKTYSKGTITFHFFFGSLNSFSRFWKAVF